MTVQKNIICLKYGTTYGPEYVNVLYNACRPSLAEGTRFICLTNDPTGIDVGVDCLPIPDIGLTEAEWFVGGVWPKVGIFDVAALGVTGRCVFIDLDMVVVGDIDRFFDIEGELVGINAGAQWGKASRSDPARLGSAVLAWDAGHKSDLVDYFRANKEHVIGSFRTEQAFLQSNAPELTYWPDDWVISFKRRLRRPIGLDLILPPKAPTRPAKLVAFHGTPRPIDLITTRGFWDRLPHLGWGRVPWMASYWDQHQTRGQTHT